MQSPRVHLLASLSLEGRLLLDPAVTTPLIDHFLPVRVTRVMSNLVIPSELLHPKICPLATRQILEHLTGSRAAAWILGSAQLHQRLLTQNLASDIHIYWQALFSTSAKSPHLSPPFHPGPELRIRLKLKKWQPTQGGIFAHYAI